MTRQPQKGKKLFATWKITGHICTYVLSVVLAIWSGENPRVLLYAHGFSVLYKLIAIWLFALAVDRNGSKGSLGKLFTREPKKWERSKPWQESRTREPARITNYIVVVFTLLFTVGVVLRMGAGPGFLSRRVLIPEAGWALFIALLYLVGDLINKQLVVSSNKPVSINLGYNVEGLNFLMAAVFISAFLLVFTMIVASWLSKSNQPVVAVEWLLLLVLGFIRLIYDILREKKNTSV